MYINFIHYAKNKTIYKKVITIKSNVNLITLDIRFN